MAKKINKKKKFGPGAKLCSLLKHVATFAKGKEELKDGDGDYCLWGQVAHAVGVRPVIISGQTNFLDAANSWLEDEDEEGFSARNFNKAERAVLRCSGAGQWDHNREAMAVKTACRAAEGMTVGHFTKLMGRVGLLPKPKKRKK